MGELRESQILGNIYPHEANVLDDIMTGELERLDNIEPIVLDNIRTGELKKLYNIEPIVLDDIRTGELEKLELRLEDLNMFTNYSLYVRAHTKV